MNMGDFFSEAEAKGLKQAPNGTYIYGDQYSTVAYRRTYTQDGTELPYLAVFTGPSLGDTNKVAGPIDFLPALDHVNIVSHIYSFEGNDIFNETVRSAVRESKNPIIQEFTYISGSRSVMRNEIVISNGAKIQEVGDILPIIVVGNSYDGSKAKTMSFGLTMGDNNNRKSFCFSSKVLGSMRQVHKTFAQSTMSSTIGRYVSKFPQTITQLLAANFSNPISDEDIMNSLELVERMSGKKRRDMISAYLVDLAKENEKKLPITSWQMFLTICKFSTEERNINAKKIMEDIAESCLVLPTDMIKALRN